MRGCQQVISIFYGLLCAKAAGLTVVEEGASKAAFDPVRATEKGRGWRRLRPLQVGLR